jgi:hypothetical protein
MADRIASHKTRTNLSITKECSELMTAISKKNGISRNAVIELAVRMLAESEGVTADKQS